MTRAGGWLAPLRCRCRWWWQPGRCRTGSRVGGLPGLTAPRGWHHAHLHAWVFWGGVSAVAGAWPLPPVVCRRRVCVVGASPNPSRWPQPRPPATSPARQHTCAVLTTPTGRVALVQASKQAVRGRVRYPIKLATTLKTQAQRFASHHHPGQRHFFRVRVKSPCQPECRGFLLRRRRSGGFFYTGVLFFL